MTDLIGEIRARDEHAAPLCAYRQPDGTVSSTFSAEQEDRRTLLRLLDATREELADALGRIDTLTDRVITTETARTDAADLQRELDEMRRVWADTPTTEAAVAKLREWVPDYEDGAMMVAMPVATARRLLGELDRLAAESRLVHAIINQDRPGSCGRATVHKPHNWLPPRSAVHCPGLGPDATEPQEAPQVAYEFGFENMDRVGEGPMMVGRPEADVRAAMAEKAGMFPECRYALRRRIVGPWLTTEDAAPGRAGHESGR